MAIQPMALQVQNPQINAVQDFQQGEASALNANASRMNQEAAGLQQFAEIGLGVMDGNPDGPIHQDRLDQVIGALGSNPIATHLKQNPELLRTIVKGSMEVLKYKQDQARFDLEKQKFEDSLKTAASGSDETFAMQPTYYKVTGADGKTSVQFGQLGNRGTFKPTTLPDGAVPALPVQQLNTETGFQPVTKFGDIPPDAPVTPIDNAGAAKDTAIGKGEGELQVAMPALKRKAEGSLNALERQTGLVTDSIDKAITQAEGNPLWNTGVLGDWTKAQAGTPAYDLAQTLLTIQSNVGFDTLQEMRNNSPTGGALGAISDTETRLLQAVKGATAQGQSLAQFKENLSNLKSLYAQVLAERKAAYAQDFGGGGAPASPSATPASTAAPASAPADNFDPSTMTDDELLTFLGGK